MVAKSQNTAFEGSLADLSVVDLLQALRVAQKTGLLVLRGTGVEAALTFDQGRVVSCRHPQPDVHIGKLLIERGAVSAAAIEQGLRRQETAGKARRPLVATLVDMGLLAQDTGFRALEQLVDMTVSAVQAWPAGTFAFDRQEAVSLDGFRHNPAAAGPEPADDTQGMLTAALHIFDEHTEAATAERASPPPTAPAPWQSLVEAFALGASTAVERPAAQAPPAVELRNACQVVGAALAAQLERGNAAAENLRRVAGEMTALRDCVREIRFPKGPADVSLILIRHLARLVERCILFLVREHDLLALSAFGLDGEPEPASAIMTRLKLRLDRGSLLDAVVSTGTIHFGPSADVAFPARLHGVIGQPTSPDIILLPLRTRERTAALIYGDFGHAESRALDTVALQIAAEFAGMAFDLALHERGGAPPVAPVEPTAPVAPAPVPRPHFDDRDLPVPVRRRRARRPGRRP